MAVFSYTPPPTIRRFMLDDHFARFVIGPLGSGKSTGMFMELLRRAVEQAPDKDGVRPTRFAVIRNTLPQLRQTCLADMRQIIQPLFEYKIYENPPGEHEFAFTDTVVAREARLEIYEFLSRYLNPPQPKATQRPPRTPKQPDCQ